MTSHYSGIMDNGLRISNLTFKGNQIYYGWIIVAGMGLVTMVSVVLLCINFGLFIEPISREISVGQAFFGWSQSGRLRGSLWPPSPSSRSPICRALRSPVHRLLLVQSKWPPGSSGADAHASAKQRNSV